MLQRLHKRIANRIQSEQSPGRFWHSIAVAEYARNMGLRLGIDADRCTCVGIAHDLAREWPVKRLLQIATDAHWQLDELERAHPMLLHGRVAAYLLQHQYAIEADDILQAVRYHTLGHPDLGPLGKVLFCADYLSPDRIYVEESFRLSTMNLELDQIVLAVIEHARSHLRKMAPITLRFAMRLQADASVDVDAVALEVGG